MLSLLDIGNSCSIFRNSTYRNLEFKKFIERMTIKFKLIHCVAFLYFKSHFFFPYFFSFLRYYVVVTRNERRNLLQLTRRHLVLMLYCNLQCDRRTPMCQEPIRKYAWESCSSLIWQGLREQQIHITMANVW